VLESAGAGCIYVWFWRRRLRDGHDDIILAAYLE
jgi:hypothetical protein